MSYVQTIGTFSPDNLVASHEFPLLPTLITVASGQGVLLRGTVLGKITASSKYKKTDKAQTDGSQIASMVLADDVDTTTADVKVAAYKSGCFSRKALFFGGASTVADHEDQLRDVSIIVFDSYSNT